MKVLDLFAGIGGFTIGLERAGFETVAFCEIEPYAQKVLKKNWPEVPIYDDVRTITAERLASDGIRVDVITGGFPCQDISVAGKQAGIEGERSGLWSECARLIRELQPRYAIFENVTNLLNGERGDWFKRVLWDISALGYDAEWHCIPASELGAHHKRDRVWIVAYPNGDDRRRKCSTESYRREPWLESRSGGERQLERQATSDVADTDSKGLQGVWQGRTLQEWCEAIVYGRQSSESLGRAWATEPDVGRVANGVPSRSHRLKCLGNAVVPQIPELLGRAILEDSKRRSA